MQRIISEIADIVRELSWSGEPYFQLFIIPVWQKWVRLNRICAVFFFKDGAIIAGVWGVWGGRGTSVSQISASIVSGKPLTVDIKLIIKIIADSLIMTHPRCLGKKREVFFCLFELKPAGQLLSHVRPSMRWHPGWRSAMRLKIRTSGFYVMRINWKFFGLCRLFWRRALDWRAPDVLRSHSQQTNQSDKAIFL